MGGESSQDPDPTTVALGAFTWQAPFDGVPVIGFVDRTRSGLGPEVTYDRDVAEFKQRLESLLSAGVRFAVVDFQCYRLTASDNGRAVVGALLAAHRALGERDGGLFVCHHPAQLNPDLQGVFKFDRVIGIYRTRPEAIAAAEPAG